MRRRYVTNRASKASLNRSKQIIVACCAAIAMILGAMSVGATRSVANPDDGSKPVLLNEDTSFSNGSNSSSSQTHARADALAGLQVLPLNTSRPYTTPIDTKSKNKSVKLNVLLGANPIRLNIAAETTGKGLKINLDVNNAASAAVQVSVPEVIPVDTSTITQDPAPTDTTTGDQPTGTTTGDGTTTDPGTTNEQQITTITPDSP